MENKNNLPAKNPLIEQLQGDLISGLVEGLLPQIQPFIAPAMEKLQEYFGNDEKMFIMKRINGQVKVIVLDNTKGSYEISRDVSVDETTKKENVVNIFEADKNVVIAVHDINSFIEQLLTGKFTIET